MLSQPQETMELQNKQGKAMAVKSLAFPNNDVNNFVVGCEEGAICTGMFEYIFFIGLYYLRKCICFKRQWEFL